MTLTPQFAVAGVAGRMGRQVVDLLLTRGLGLAGGTETPGSAHIQTDIATLAGHATPLHRRPVTDPVDAAEGAHAWIDFTTPAATLAALQALRHTTVHAVIIGTTGFSEPDEREIECAARHFAIVRSGNFSQGVTLLKALVREAAARLGPDWDIEVLETHHRMKRDAPSGTALMLGEAAATGRGQPLSALRAAPYDGVGALRTDGAIGFAVRRSGGVVGEHEVTFASGAEVVTLGHAALDRTVFAEGAVAAAFWALSQPAGLYTMDNVLGLAGPD